MSGTVPAPSNPQIDSNGAIIFNYQAWAARFPTLAQSVTMDVAQIYFDDAGSLYFNNSAGSAAGNLDKRQRILFLITAHLATLFSPINGKPPSGVVGRVSNASEGSVSVGTDKIGPDSAQWWMQTPYGASAYQAMRKYALTWYFPGPQRFFQGPYPPFWRRVT